MNSQPNTPRGYLPRLPVEHYRGQAIVFWTHTVALRATGWLDECFHAAFRETMLHAAVREQLLCPVYVLMPDHLHLLWMGVAEESDQRVATRFLRETLAPSFSTAKLQHQPHDHVLKEAERQRGAFVATCAYVLENPVRAALCSRREDWRFSGCIVPGYPRLDPRVPEFWERFWAIYNACVARGRPGKMQTKTAD
ncbi:MAG: hypothetical protein HYV96_01455 [Opitutae bacterium]|nr:hypothetical protein [Opitutae bacterium]